MLLKLLEKLGRYTISFFFDAGGIFLFLLKSIKFIFRKPFDAKNLIIQMHNVGINSFLVVSLTSITTGMVLALQVSSTLEYRIQGVSEFLGGVVAVAMTRELGPVLIALIIAGRIGSSFAAEIGTMKITEQIDALSTMATNPIHYLSVPRLLACAIMVPVLTLYGDLIGIIGGMIISNVYAGIDIVHYFDNVAFYLYMYDITSGLIKSFIFGIIISTVGCYIGFQTEGGAEGVGKATTKAVVIGFILVLIFDYIITAILF
jgi:phospholipid/cholesterol/gamma-HCH transport system permease protein